MPSQGEIVSEQHISVQVNGPDGANTLFIATGLMRCILSDADTTGSSDPTRATFSAALATPTLTAGQFRRAIATASLAAINGDFPASSSASGAGHTWYVNSVDADFDDESGRIELVVDLQVGANHGNAEIVAVGFQAMTTAAV